MKFPKQLGPKQSTRKQRLSCGLACIAITGAACSSARTAAPQPLGVSSTSFTGNVQSKKHTTGPTTATPATQQGSPDPNAKEIIPPGDIPDKQAFVPFTPASKVFVVSYPEGWSQRTNGAVTTFTDKFNTITVKQSSLASAPTIASASNVEVPHLASILKQFKLVKVDSVNRRSGAVLHLSYAAVSGIDEVTGKTILLDVDRYEFYRNGVLVTITLSASKGSDNVDPWATITNSFGWK